MSIDGSRVGIAIAVGGFVCSSLPHVILGISGGFSAGLAGILLKSGAQEIVDPWMLKGSTSAHVFVRAQYMIGSQEQSTLLRTTGAVLFRTKANHKSGLMTNAKRPTSYPLSGSVLSPHQWAPEKKGEWMPRRPRVSRGVRVPLTVQRQAQGKPDGRKLDANKNSGQFNSVDYLVRAMIVANHSSSQAYKPKPVLSMASDLSAVANRPSVETEKGCLLGPLRKRAVAARTVIVRGYWRLTNEHPGQQGDKPHPTHACHLRPPSTYQNRHLFVKAHSIWTINLNTCHFLFKQRDRDVEFTCTWPSPYLAQYTRETEAQGEQVRALRNEVGR
ncbi:hypothetical protein GE21DRAFT_6364 [Neurospora crassa]|uniref:Uncharacterized protein n=1 Tax=Neurospora crassa (strain ATCC 24698 / 74-OR23-1A / CBS 708.71 / DSM 1257 / FGSC 987) TaxID=367110 RepID=Q7SA45_NEUCR|nr:hypothetical protein NCU07317 [Neurospora crassa OR74A]EAA33239.1 hypothetical protein NCU07317 [Neurospora crassa OR74A]KHE88748.1 hypothetical protein GE21DRAFT_6364 [Neurospora crassa]|eukprot:XP_962475.1 hypothetical protein NCU07317 [Neurospora crassa OR74A]